MPYFRLAARARWVEAGLREAFEGKVKGRVRVSRDEFRILNRIVRRTEAGYEWDADQCHVVLLVAAAGLGGGSHELTQPGTTFTAKELDTEDCESSEADAHKYRARIARANFLTRDRPDMAFSVTELCWGMSERTGRDREDVKRLSRERFGRPRVAIGREYRRVRTSCPTALGRGVPRPASRPREEPRSEARTH